MANDLKEKDPIQEHYDNEFDRLTSPQNYSKDGKEPDLQDRESRPDGTHDNVGLSPHEQAQVDQMDAGLRENNLYDPDGVQQHHKRSLQSRLKGAFSGRKKYGWLGGGVLAALLGAFLSFIPVLGPVHIFNTLSNHNFEYNDSFRRNRTGRVIRSILARNADTSRNFRDTPFLVKADLVEFERFESRMQSHGWTFEYNSDGKAIGLVDPDGQLVNLSETNRAEFTRRVQPLIDDTIPAWQMNKRMRTRSLISTFTGPRRSFVWSKLFGAEARQQEPNFEARKFIKETGLEDPDIRQSVDTNERTVTTDENGSPVVNETDSSSGDAATDAVQAAIDAKLAGATDAEALAAYQTRVNEVSHSRAGGRTSVIVGSLVVSCIAHSVYESEVFSQHERYAAALRYGATFMSAAHEIQQGGDIDAGEVGQHFSEYNNFEPTRVEVQTPEGPEVVEYGTGSFANSAAWQRATGDAVTGSEISNEHRVLPDESGGGAVRNIFVGAVTAVGGAASLIPGMGILCDFVNSGFFFAVSFLLDGIEAFSAAAACLTGVGCAALGKFAVAEGLFELASRLLSAAATAFVGYLITHPEQALAVLDQSFSLISTEESRTGEPLENSEYNNEVTAFKMQQNKNRSFVERYFAMDNINSLISGLARARLSFQNINPATAFTSIFRLPANTLAAAATSSNVYAQTDINFDNYGFQKYSYNNSYLDVDPFEHAEEVMDLIIEDEDVLIGAGANDNGNYARDFAMLCMGFVPETGLVDKTEQNPYFLPRFSNPEASDAKARNDAFQKVCLDEASADPDLYTAVGRFVDDIELVSSIIELTGQEVPPSGGINSTDANPSAGGGGGGEGSPSPPVEPPEACDPNVPSDECLN